MSYLELNKHLTDQEQAIKTEVHRFAEEVLRPASMELDRLPDPADVIAEGSVYWEVFRKAYELGYHTSAPARRAGRRRPVAAGAAHLSRGDGLGRRRFRRWHRRDLVPVLLRCVRGNPHIMEEVVRPFVADREARYIGCWAITEPQHGSDMLIVGTDTFRDPKAAGESPRRSWTATSG